MKKINMLLTGMLVLVTVLGVLAVGAFVSEPLKVDIKLPPSAPVLSAGSGFYDESFELAITARSGAEIYYTLDGSAPDVSSLHYEEPIPIKAGGGLDAPVTYVPNSTKNWVYGEGESHENVATVLRAVAVDGDGQCSDIVTATYFVGKTGYEDKTVISIVADPEELFGGNGIYVTGEEYDDWYTGDREGPEPVPNFLKHGREWEREAVIEIFRDTSSFLQQPVGIRIQGASARDVPNKRFSVYARKEYGGSSWFNASLFSGGRTHAFVLRSGFMNGYIQHLVQDRDVASAESGEVIVYLNGAIWYITIAQEKYTEKYFQEHYGVDDDNVILLKEGVVESGDAADQALYQAVYDCLESVDMTLDESYDVVNELMDIQSYIDFTCVNVYFGNLDYSEYKNFACWRAREPQTGEYGDGRWRWALYDLDLENLDYGVTMENINTFSMDTHYAGSALNTRPMYAALKKNVVFCRQFVISFLDMVNTDFTVEHAKEAWEDWEITPAWWGMSDEWPETFFPARTEAVLGFLAEEFGLTGKCETVTVSVSGQDDGYIHVNTVTPELKDGSFSGIYFTDYPITVTAVANGGHRFVGWRRDGDDGIFSDRETVTVEIPDGGLCLTAVFE